MITQFFNDNIASLLIADNKDFRECTDDLRTLDVLMRKMRDPEHGDVFNFLLDDKLINYKITKEEEILILNCFKNHVKNKTKNAIQCIGYLELTLLDDGFVFLFEEFKKNIHENMFLAITLLNNLNTFVHDDNLQELITFLKLQLKSDVLEKRFKQYIREFIDYKEGRISNLNIPMVCDDENGNNLRVEWWDGIKHS